MDYVILFLVVGAFVYFAYTRFIKNYLNEKLARPESRPHPSEGDTPRTDTDKVE